MSLEKWSKENYLHEKKKWDKIGNKKAQEKKSPKKQHTTESSMPGWLLVKCHTMLGLECYSNFLMYQYYILKPVFYLEISQMDEIL